jgi:hypothetical protein
MRKPSTFEELRIFYLKEYRPLYDRFVVENKLPQELHAEVAAAFDHLMRNSLKNGNIQKFDLDRVTGHLKRATFDSFKLLFERIRDKYDRLMHYRYANVEDGNFQPRITKMFNEAKTIAIAARSYEHLSDSVDPEAWAQAFQKWKELLPILDQFQQEENSDKIIRVKKLVFRDKLYSAMDKFLWAALGAAMGWLGPKLFDWFRCIFCPES